MQVPLEALRSDRHDPIFESSMSLGGAILVGPKSADQLKIKQAYDGFCRSHIGGAMPEPTKDFIAAFKNLPAPPDISLICAYKRFFKARQLDRAVTSEAFLSNHANLVRQRESITLHILDTGPTAFLDVLRALSSQGGGKPSGWRRRLKIYLQEHPGVKAFDSISALMVILEEQPKGPKNLISVEGTSFHNLAAFKQAHLSTISISERHLAQRVQVMRAQRNLSKEDALYLTAEECQALLSRWENPKHFDAFKVDLSSYLEAHELILVQGGDSSDSASLKPISLEDAYDRYENNRSVLYFYCKNCNRKGRAPFFFGKSRDHWGRQGCPVCSLDRRSEKRRRNPGELRKLIAEHPARVVWIDEESAYRNNRSILRLQCLAKEHQFSVSASSILYGDFVVCPDCARSRIGESLAVAIVNFILNTGRPAREVRELTPPHLAGTGLRHDAYFDVAPIGMKIALEHDGPQHQDENHGFHAMSPKGKEVSYKETIERDRVKRDACQAGGVAIVNIPDLFAACGRLRKGGAFIAAARIAICQLEFSTKGKVRELPGYAERVNLLSEENFVRSLLPEAYFRKPIERLQEQLDAEGRSILIRAYDPITSHFELECLVDGKIWSAHANNALRSRSNNGRPGSRCPTCAVKARADKQRLSFEKLKERAIALRFRPLFVDADYQNNETILNWECLVNPLHVIRVSFDHLNRGCPQCRLMARNKYRQDKAYAEIKKIVESHGNKLLSPPEEYTNNRSRLRVHCKVCESEYHAMGGKLKRGQRHGCDKGYRAAKTRRAGGARSM